MQFKEPWADEWRILLAIVAQTFSFGSASLSQSSRFCHDDSGGPWLKSDDCRACRSQDFLSCLPLEPLPSKFASEMYIA
jgi:hypothetical protein